MIPNKSSPKQNRRKKHIVLHRENMNEGSLDNVGLGRCQELIVRTLTRSRAEAWISIALPSALPVEPWVVTAHWRLGAQRKPAPLCCEIL
jgi:hypothetical protein